MEPFRPVVDIAVYRLLETRYPYEEELTPQIKRDLIGLLDVEYLEYEKGLSTLRSVSKLYIQLFKRAVVENDPKLLSFPHFDTEILDESI